MMLEWIKSWFQPQFRPGVFYNADLRLTEIILRDAAIVWIPWGPYQGHAVDCGYDTDGSLVGIKIWDDVRQRPEDRPSRPIVDGAQLLRDLYDTNRN